VKRRLRHAPATRAAISAALQGHAVSAETRAAIAAKLTGRVVSEATRAKLRAARARQLAADPATEARVASRARKRAERNERREQWFRDMAVAYRLDLTLWADVKRSGGWSDRRKKFDATGQVSDGWRKVDGCKKS
jgi:hypothetical protein